MLFSSVFATTYSVPVEVSITGVPVIPISGTMSLHWMLEFGTVVTPAAGLIKLTCHRGDAFAPALLSASKA